MVSEATPRARRKRPSRLPYVIALGLLGVFVAMAWFARDRFQPLAAGSPAPEFTAVNLQGDAVRLSDYRGKVLMVNVWATWCEPCKQEMPSMERLYQKVRSLPDGEDFEILAVSIDASVDRPDVYGSASESELAEYARNLGLSFPIVHDAPGTVEKKYQTTGVPETFIVGRDGTILLKRAGPQEWDAPQFEELISRLLAQG